MNAKKRHFIKTWAAVLSICLGLFTFNAAMVGGAQAIHHHNQVTSAEKTRHAAHFYAIIDGRSPATGNTVDVALATDLKSALGPHDGGRLPQNIREFQGSSTSYGGITAIIGFSPFDNAGLGCTECGPLTDRMMKALADIKSGHDGYLFKGQSVKANTYTLTPLGMSWLLFFMICWIFVSSFAAYMAKIRDPEGFAAFASDSLTPRWVWLTAPLFWTVQWVAAGQRIRTENERVRMMFPEQLAAIESADKVLSHYGPAASDRTVKLRDARNMVMTQLREQASSGANAGNDLQLQQAMGELQDALDFLAARNQAVKELVNPDA